MGTLVDPNIALQATVPDPVAAISKVQTLGNLQLAGQGQSIANQTNQGNLNETNAARQLLSDPASHNPDGSLTVDAQNKLSQVAPTLGSGISNNSAIANTNQTGAAKAHLQLAGEQQQVGRNALQAMFGNPDIMGTPGTPAVTDDKGNVITPATPPKPPDPTKATTAILNQVDSAVAAGMPREQAYMQAGPMLTAAAHAPEQLPNIIKTMMQQSTGAQGVMTANTPNLVDSGGTLNNVNPLMPQGQIPKTLAPSQIQTTGTDQFGNPVAINHAPSGPISSVTPITGGVQNGAKPPPVMQLPPGETPASLTQLQNERAQVNAAAAQVPTQNFNSDQVIKLAQDTKTGPGTAGFQKIAAAIGVPEASNYQQLGHFLALQQQSMGAAMGVHTDAGQTLAGSTSGTTEMTPQALTAVAQTNKALANGLADFNKGMETAITTSGQGPFAKRQFQTQWAQNFNPVNYQLKDAVSSGDTARANTIIKGMTPAQLQTLQQQNQNILNLTNQGHL